jgi:hypothetical protein
MGKGRNKIKDLDRFHYHEALDRAYIIGNMINEHLTEHPVIMKHKKLRKLIKVAEQNVMDVYQMIGGLDMKLFPNDSEQRGKQ